MTETPTLAVRPADPYGANTLVTEQERQRMKLQFNQHAFSILQSAVAALGGMAGLTVLDVGSGLGALPASLGQTGELPAELRLMDLNPGLLTRAGTVARDAGINTRTHLGAIDRSPLPDHLRNNDLVLCAFTATHVIDLPAAIQHMAAAVRPQGLVVIVDVDYCESFTVGDAAAAQALAAVQSKLQPHQLATRLPRLAAACGLHATDDIGCASWLQVYSGRIDVQQTGLGFIGSFLPHDPAVAPWRDIGPDARLFMQRLAHVYRRV